MKGQFSDLDILGKSPKETDAQIAGKPVSMYLERIFA